MQSSNHVHNTGDASHTPKYFLVWLDQHIGKRDECVLLKSQFFLALDPTTGRYERAIKPDDLDKSINLEIPLIVKLDDVEFLFQAFETVEKCFHAIEQNVNKRIFLITSGSKGKMLIPSLIVNFSETFVPEYWMFVFCANMRMNQTNEEEAPTNLWALNYVENVLMFDHQDEVLARMVLEMGHFFFKEAQGLCDQRLFLEASQHCRWANAMYKRFGLIENRSTTSYVKKVEELENTIEILRRKEQDADDSDGVGESVSEF